MLGNSSLGLVYNFCDFWLVSVLGKSSLILVYNFCDFRLVSVLRKCFLGLVHKFWNFRLVSVLGKSLLVLVRSLGIFGIIPVLGVNIVYDDFVGVNLPVGLSYKFWGFCSLSTQIMRCVVAFGSGWFDLVRV